MPKHPFITALRVAFLGLALLAWAAPAPCQEYAWRERGYGGGGRYTAVAINPADSAQVFVGSDVTGFYKSTDGGETFRVLGAGLEGFAVAGIALDPEDARKMLVLADDGLYASDDAGENVAKITGKVRYNSRTTGSRLLVRHRDAWFAATDSDGVFKAVRKPTGWEVSPVFGLEGKKVHALAPYKGRLAAATDEGVFLHDGEIWKLLREGFAPGKRDIVDLAVHPSGRFYAVEMQTGLYTYNERSASWERRGPNPAVLPSQSGKPAFKALAVSPQNPDLVFLAMHPDTWPPLLLRSQDGGRNWTLIKRFTLAGAHENWAKDLESVEQIVFSPDGRTAFLTDWWNVWRSVDGGGSWLQLHRGLQNTVVNAIARSPQKPDTLYLATDDNGLMVSRDNGRSWRRRMAQVIDGHAKAVCVSARNPNLVYLLMAPWKPEDTEEFKVFNAYKSLDGGDTWTALRWRDARRVLDKPFATGLPSCLVIDPANDDVIYAGANGYGIYRIDTAGAGKPGTQSEIKALKISSGIPTPYLKTAQSLLVSRADPRVILAATQEGGIFRSGDGGGSWKPVGPSRSFVQALAEDPANPSRIYAAAAEKRILTSTDAGLTWKAADLPGPRPGYIAANTVAVDPADPSVVYAGTLAYNLKAADGLFVSRDHGASFIPIPSALPRISITALEVFAEPHALLVGFNGLGLYEVVRAPGKDGR